MCGFCLQPAAGHVGHNATSHLPGDDAGPQLILSSFQRARRCRLNLNSVEQQAQTRTIYEGLSGDWVLPLSLRSDFTTATALLEKALEQHRQG